MNLGAEPKKLVMLCGLLLVAGYLVYTNLLAPGEDTASAAAPAAKTALPSPTSARPTAESQAGLPTAESSAAESRRDREGGVAEFHPSLKPREGKERIDTTKLDPTLEIYRLDQLQQIAYAGSSRNLFEFSAAPPPPVPDVKIAVKPPPLVEKPPEVVAPPPPPPGPPPAPKAPPIPLKYYGYTQKEFEIRTRNGGARRGLFLRGGEEIFVASEGDVIDKHYKVITLRENQAILQDTNFDADRQTLPIVSPDAAN